MRTSILIATCLAVATLAASPAVSADDEAVFTKLSMEKADAVVSVKFVMTVKITQGGTAVMAPREDERTVTGVIVDKSGLVMLPGSAMGAGGIPRQILERFDVSAVASNIRVVFPGDTRDYDAVLGAKDSKLGLAFVMVKDLAEKVLTPLDMETAAEPKLGQTLYGVSRLDQGFDHAPLVTRTKISGRVTKPRTMWIVDGAGNHVGKPLYDASAAMTGIVVSQEGVGNNSIIRPFLLSLSVAKPTVATALKKSKAELDRILEEEEEAAAEAAAAKEDEEKKGTEKKGTEKKGDEEKDAPKEEPEKDAPKEEPKKDAPKEEPKKDAPKEEPKKDAPKDGGQ